MTLGYSPSQSLLAASAPPQHTPGPWEYIPSTEHHGPYVAAYGDICDCYAMSNPSAASVRNGGDSYPIPHQGDRADANARLIAAAPELLECARILAALEREDHGRGFPTVADCAQARAAIAKATGQ